MAHRSRDWTRQNGGRAGGGGAARVLRFLAGVRALAREEPRARVLVTTVGSRLLADLVVFADTPPDATGSVPGAPRRSPPGPARRRTCGNTNICSLS